MGQFDLDDPANAETVRAVLRALHDRCPAEYHHAQASDAFCAWCTDEHAIRRDRARHSYWRDESAARGVPAYEPVRPGPPCVECGEHVDPEFAVHSGGLCGDCLANYAVPLTHIAGQVRQPGDRTHYEQAKRSWITHCNEELRASRAETGGGGDAGV